MSKVKITIEATPETWERVNALIAHCIDVLKKSEEQRNYFDCSPTQILELEQWREDFLSGFLTQPEKQ